MLTRTTDHEIDCLRRLNEHEIEYVRASDTRVFVIYHTAVLELQVNAGTTTAARSITVDVIDPPEIESVDADDLLEEFEGDLLA